MIETELLHYGYLFVVLGTVLEGDATLLTAAFLAHRGYFRWSLVVVTAALTTIVTSHIYYCIAQRSGGVWLAQRQDHRLDRIARWSASHGGLLLVGSRFLIGLRTLVPIVCGATGMRPGRFFFWNSLGAALWAIAFGGFGYFGGHVITTLANDVRRHEKLIAAVLAVTIAGGILWRTRGRELYDAWALRR